MYRKKSIKRALLWLFASCVGLAVVLVVASSSVWNTKLGNVEIRRTADGIPHIRADNWRDLGLGYGYVQAQDALCTLADAFVTFEGRRSYFFGAQKRPRVDSTFGRPRNIELDFFFRTFADEAMVVEYQKQQPHDLNELIVGFAEGYNRYLQETHRLSSISTNPLPVCLHESWVREITPGDIYRRMIAASLAAGYVKFIPEIVNATPDTPASVGISDGRLNLHQRLANVIGQQPGLGSNAMAFGRQATGENEAVLFGNPHWYWSGPDRFYQAHLTIPGRLNVAGVSFLGIPIIMIGFNNQVAWSHTVSEARRFGLFELELDPADRTRYRYDGVSEAMRSVSLTVETRTEGGAVVPVTRTLYHTRFGPIVDLGAHTSDFGWSAKRALAIRDVNAKNFRIFRTFFQWNQADSLDEFVAIQRREAAIPWVNTVAIARGDGRVWYGDIGAVPNVPDALRRLCTTELGKTFAQLDAKTPFLDGRRSECDWQIDERAVQPGAMPAQSQPGLFREDYVANMNDSYWLSNPHQRLEGYPEIMGGEREALSLRSRLGHQMAQYWLAKAPISAQELNEYLRQDVLSARAYSAELFKTSVLDRVCPEGRVEVRQDVLTEQRFSPPQRVDITSACKVLRGWQNRGNVQDRGAHLWDAFWVRVARIPVAERFRVPFSPDKPLVTPNELNVDDPRVAQALGAAVLAVAASGIALDAPRGKYLHAGGARSHISLYGGCHEVGYFTVVCGSEGGYKVDGEFGGNSYLQMVSFGAEGVEAYTLLAHGQRGWTSDVHSLDGEVDDALRRYAEKRWLRFPFSEAQILRNPELRRIVLRR